MDDPQQSSYLHFKTLYRLELLLALAELEIVVDGKSVGRRSTKSEQLITVTPGHHIIEAVVGGAKTRVYELDIQPGDHVHITCETEPARTVTMYAVLALATVAFYLIFIVHTLLPGILFEFLTLMGTMWLTLSGLAPRGNIRLKTDSGALKRAKEVTKKETTRVLLQENPENTSTPER